MAKQFDVIVIGGGPGGYIAAIRAAQLGFNTACIDEWKTKDGKAALGGTCTNVGCIPSKALLQSSENYEQAAKHFGDHGIKVSGLDIDVAKMLGRKDGVVKQNNDGILFLFKKNKVTFFHGRGAFVGKGDGGCDVKVGDETLTGKHIIIATGSNARALPGAPFDEDRILSNDGALRIPSVPKKLGMIGSGVIGLEMGSVWRRIGSDVTILEALPTFLGAVDEQIAKEAKKAFDKQGLKIELGVKVGEVKQTKQGVTVSYTSAAGEAKKLEVDRLIVSIGRVPNTIGLNAEAIGLKLDERGAIAVDDQCKTNVANVWAIGDVVRGPMLAHKAEEEGVAFAEHLVTGWGHVNYDAIPAVVYIHPELASVGRTEEQLKEAGVEYRKGVFAFRANGRAHSLGETDGKIKVLADAKTDRVLGVHILGPRAGDLIAEATAAMTFGASSEDIARTCHAHPTLSETLKEAALAVAGRQIHS